MATPIQSYYQPFRPRDSSELPEWFVVEAYHCEGSGGWSLRAGVRCRDGDLEIFDMPIFINVNPGRSLTLSMRKREVLEQMRDHIVTELAKLELEE
jgi:hypothetical protein